MSASSLIQYNRATQSNIEDLNIPIGTTPVLLLEMGIFNPVTTVNFLEIVSSIGWRTANASLTITFNIIVDGTIVGTTDEQMFVAIVQDTQTDANFVIVNGPLTMDASVYA